MRLFPEEVISMISKKFLLIFSLYLFSTTFCFAAEIKQGTISGRWITKDYGPMGGALVLLFNKSVGPPPSSEKYLRVPDATAIIEADGQFSVLAAAGSYYLVMRKSSVGDTVGPPQDGDLQYYSRDKMGKARSFHIKSGGITNIGTISEATVFRKQQPKYVKGMTAIEGTVTDGEGLPVEGVRVFVYTSPDMAGRPRYASEGTGKDGKYFVNVNNKGIYYLKARSRYGGGQPEAGEFMGGYGEPTAPAVVKVEKGKIRKGIDIKTNRFPGRGSNE